MRSRAALALLLVMCGACGSLLGISSEDAPPPAPAPTPAPGAGDARPDGDNPESDAGVGLDSGGGESGDADAEAGPPTTFCTSVTASLCADFDEGFLGSPFDEATVTSEIGLDATASSSSPASLLVKFTAPAAGGHLGKTFSGAAFTKIDVRFDARFDALASSDEFELVRVTTADGTTVGLVANTDFPQARLHLVVSGTDKDELPVPSSAGFHSLKLVVDYAGGFVSIAVDGTTAPEAFTLPSSVANPNVRVGAISSSSTSGMRIVHVDNFVVTVL